MDFNITGTSAAIPRLRISDFDGDNKTDTAVWRQNSTGDWVLFKSTTHALQVQVDWGHASLGGIAVPGDYDGDNKTDIAVFRGSEGTWYIIQSSDNTVNLRSLGLSGDVPVPSAYLPQ